MSVSRLNKQLRNIRKNLPELLDKRIWKPHKGKLPQHVKGRRVRNFSWGGTHPDQFNDDGLLTFDEAAEQAEQFELDGVGLYAKDGVTSWDLDDAYYFDRDEETKEDFNNGEINAWATKCVHWAETYAERSQSGNGLHILSLADVPEEDCGDHKLNLPTQSGKVPQIEIRSNLYRGFVAITGDQINDKPLAKSGDIVDFLRGLPLRPRATVSVESLDDYDGERGWDETKAVDRWDDLTDKSPSNSKGDPDRSWIDDCWTKWAFKCGYHIDDIRDFLVSNSSKASDREDYLERTLVHAWSVVCSDRQTEQDRFKDATRRALKSNWGHVLDRWVVHYNQGPEPVFDTGNVILPLGPGRMTVLGGGTGAGKTTLAIQAITEVALNHKGQKILYVSTEMSEERLAQRQIGIQSGLSATDLRERKFDLSKDTRSVRKIQRAIEDLQQIELKIMPDPATMGNLETWIDEYEPSIIVVDYLQQLALRSSDDMRRAIDNTLLRFRELANRDGICFLILSALARNSEVFRESGEIEYGSDNAFILLPPSEDPKVIRDTFEMKAIKRRDAEEFTRYLTQDRSLKFEPCDAFEPEDGPEAETATRKSRDKTGAAKIGGSRKRSDTKREEAAEEAAEKAYQDAESRRVTN